MTVECSLMYYYSVRSYRCFLLTFLIKSNCFRMRNTVRVVVVVVGYSVVGRCRTGEAKSIGESPRSFSCATARIAKSSVDKGVYRTQQGNIDEHQVG